MLACLNDEDAEEFEDDEDNEDTKKMRQLQALEVASLLIAPTCAAGVLDAVDNDGMSSLMAARKNGLDDIVQMLLKAGAKPDLTDMKGSTAAGHAVGNRRHMILEGC